MWKNMKNAWMLLWHTKRSPFIVIVVDYCTGFISVQWFDMAWSKIYDLFYSLVLQLYWVDSVWMCFPFPETAWTIKNVEICREINRTGLSLSYFWKTGIQRQHILISYSYKFSIALNTLQALNSATWLRLVKFMILNIVKFDVWISIISTIIERFLKISW